MCGALSAGQKLATDKVAMAFLWRNLCLAKQFDYGARDCANSLTEPPSSWSQGDE